MGKRRSWGSGSISQPDAAGWISVRVSLGKSPDGAYQRVIRRVRTPVEAKATLKRLQEQYRPGDATGTPPRLDAYLASWICRQEGRLKPKTIRTYSTAIANLAPIIGHVRLDRLTSGLLSSAFKTLGESKRRAGVERSGTNTGERTVQQAYDVLRIALNFAIKRDQVLRTSPLGAVPRIKLEREIDFLSKKEVLAFFHALEHDPLRSLFHLAVATGMRWGEISALAWHDVDFDGAVITLHHARNEKGEIGSTKTRGSRRRIDLPLSIVRELLTHKKRQKRTIGECPYVFVSSAGTPLHASNVERRHFFPALERAGLRRIRFHDLRHTAATLRLAAGQHVKVVAELLGHASIRTTLDLYSHVLPGMGREAAAAYDRVMMDV